MKSKTLFHVTHAKAGSTWLTNIFTGAFGRRRVAKRVGGKVEKYHYVPGKIFPAIFMSYEDFMALEGADDEQCFFVIRDIRDTLVSLYFSMRYFHTDKGFPHIKRFRDEVEGMSDDEGVMHTFKNRSRPFCRVQESWLNSGKPVIKYEDLLVDTEGVLRSLFDELGFVYDVRKLQKAITANSFEATFGRRLGKVDVKSHGRQGAPGDWKNYVNDEMRALIEERFSEILTRAKYEV